MEVDGIFDWKFFSCCVIFEWGSWIEINVIKKDVLLVCID